MSSGNSCINSHVLSQPGLTVEYPKWPVCNFQVFAMQPIPEAWNWNCEELQVFFCVSGKDVLPEEVLS